MSKEKIIVLKKENSYHKKDINLFLWKMYRSTLLRKFGLHTKYYSFDTRRRRSSQCKKFNFRLTKDLLEHYNFTKKFTKYNIIKKRKDKIDFLHYDHGMKRDVQLYTDLKSKQVYFFIEDVKYIISWIGDDIKELSKYKVKEIV